MEIVGQVTDSDGNSNSITLTVTVNPVNDVPVIDLGQVFSATEDLLSTDVIGRPTASDVEESPPFTKWRIDGSDFGIFDISDQGDIHFKNGVSIDFETMTQTTFDLLVSTTDGTATDDSDRSLSQSVTVQVVDVNDNTPVIDPGQAFSIDENSATDTVIGYVTMSDPDTVGDPPLWQLTGNSAVAIRLGTGTHLGQGELYVADVNLLDAELATEIIVSLTVSDGTNVSVPSDITITVNDLNEFAPVITSGQTFVLPEDTTAPHSLGLVTATDNDISPDVFSQWTFVSTGFDDPTGVFLLDQATGEIQLETGSGVDF